MIDLIALEDPPQHFFGLEALIVVVYMPRDCSDSSFVSVMIGDRGIQLLR